MPSRSIAMTPLLLALALAGAAARDGYLNPPLINEPAESAKSPAAIRVVGIRGQSFQS
jgi:hypothetical protein